MFKGSTDTLFVKEIFLSLGKTVPKYLSMRYPDDYVSFEYSVLTPSLGRDTSLERPTVQRHCPFWTYTDSSGMLRTYTDHPGLMDCFQEDWFLLKHGSLLILRMPWFYYIYVDNFTHNSTTIPGTSLVHWVLPSLSAVYMVGWREETHMGTLFVNVELVISPIDEKNNIKFGPFIESNTASSLTMWNIRLFPFLSVQRTMKTGYDKLNWLNCVDTCTSVVHIAYLMWIQVTP